MKRAYGWTTLAVLFLTAAGCRENAADIANGDDPLRALTVPVRSERYPTTYWTQVSIRDTTLWAQAVAYCEERIMDHPNCEAVRTVDMLERMSRPPEESPRTFQLRPGFSDPDTTPDPDPR